ncbi:MAG: hypothetical protein ABI670_08790 [Chloroflexota bacterium]
MLIIDSLERAVHGYKAEDGQTRYLLAASKDGGFIAHMDLVAEYESGARGGPPVD